jgi:hypothetical protein
MANEFGRNIKDASANTRITRALPTADGTVTSADIDLGAEAYKGENFELQIEIPALTSTHLPSADTLTLTIQAGASATPTTSTGITHLTTGTGSTIAAQVVRFRLPSNIARYVNVKAVAAGGTGDISAVSLTISLVF